MWIQENLFISYLAATKPTLDHGRGSSFAFQISVTLFLVQPKSLWEPLNEIESLSTAKLICGIRTKSVCYIRQSVCYTRKVCCTQCNILSNCSHEAVSKTTYSNLFQTTYCTCLLIGTQRKETLFKLMNILISDRALC